MFSITSLFTVFIAIVLGGEPNPILVTVEQGVLEGVEKESRSGSYFSFKGIPFARPPLRELRFLAPQPAFKWKGIRSATDHRPVCIQPVDIAPDTSSIIGSEDCLYLNVYTPNLNSSKPLPVMFFIYGGGYVIGSGNDNIYGPDFLMNYGVILVTCNYRLNALGFLSVDTKEVPGNAGLKDQIAALQWVKKNIRCFGGDPDMVTIFGQSAGAASVGLHLLSPAAKGLFKRAISMSGSIYSQYYTSFAHKERAFNLGRRLNINTEDTYELIDRLRDVPAEKLVTRANILLSEQAPGGPILTTYFAPVLEKELGGYHYLTIEPIDSKRQGIFNDADFMMGHTNGEGLPNIILLQDPILNYYPKFKQLYVPRQISNIRSPATVQSIGESVEKYYFGSGFVTLTNIGQFLRFYSMVFYSYFIHYYMDNIVTQSSSTRRYFYEFALYSSRNAYTKQAGPRYGIRKAGHRDDLPYLFSGPGYNLSSEIDETAREYIDLMCTLFTNFAKYGNPTPNQDLGITWPEHDAQKKYLRIADKLTVGKVQYTGELGFWRDIYGSAEVTPHLEE